MTHICAHLPRDSYLDLALHTGDQTASQPRLAAVLGLRLPSLTVKAQTLRNTEVWVLAGHTVPSNGASLPWVGGGAGRSGHFREQLGVWTRAYSFVSVAAHTGDHVSPRLTEGPCQVAVRHNGVLALSSVTLRVRLLSPERRQYRDSDSRSVGCFNGR